MSSPTLATTRPLLAHSHQLCQQAHARQLIVAPDAYNCFAVLGIREQEVKHTALLADLLSPCGQHGCGSLFLAAFLKAAGILTRKLTDWEVNCEENHQHGRWDIALHGRIEGRPALVIIENKINAVEGHRQLERYLQAAHEHASRYAPADTWLIFLTPDGRSPQSNRQPSNANLLVWSYHQQIREWLAGCLPSTQSVPRLHHVLDQYLDLLTDYYNRHVQKTLSHQLAAHLLQHDLLAEAHALQDALIQTRIELQLLFWEELEQELRRLKLPLAPDVSYLYSRERITDCYRKPRSSKGYGIAIQLLYQARDHKQLLLYVELDNPKLGYGVYLYQQGQFKSAADLRRSKFGRDQMQKFADKLGLKIEEEGALLSPPLSKCLLDFVPLELADMQRLAQPVERQKLAKEVALETKKIYTQFPHA